MASANEGLNPRYEFQDAARAGNLDALKRLFSDPDKKCSCDQNAGYIALHHAAQNGRTEAVKFVLGLDGVHRNLRMYNGSTPFAWACLRGHVGVVSVMLEDDRVDINIPCRDTNATPLYSASNANHVEVVERLLASGRPVDTKTVSYSMFLEGNTVVQMARRQGRTYIADLIESYERNPDKVTQELRKKLGLRDQDIWRLFALVVYSSDGYLQCKKGLENSLGWSFFLVASRLPLELQMVLCHRVFGSTGIIVKTIHSEPAFQKYAKE